MTAATTTANAVRADTVPSTATRPAPPLSTADARLLDRLTGLAAACIAETGHCYPAELFARSAGDYSAAEAIRRHYPSIVADAGERLARRRTRR